MATRGTIGIENEDGSIAVVYSHWDNYIAYNGAILVKNYDTAEKVKQLISGGGISSLGEYVAPPEEETSFCRPKGKQYTTFYSMRGETVAVNLWGSFDDYERHQQMEEFNYLFTKDGVWSCFVEHKNDWFDVEYELEEYRKSKA